MASRKPNRSIQIILDITAIEATCLKHNLPDDQGIIDWFSAGPSSEKIAKCKERLIKEGREILMNDPCTTSMPADGDGLIAAIVAHPSYKDRVAREVRENTGSV